MEYPGTSCQKICSNFSRDIFESRKILSEFHPECIFFTGGFVAIPMAFAAQKVPKIVFVPDIEPGLALKVLARLADIIAVTVEESKKYLPSGKRITGDWLSRSLRFIQMV